MPGRAHRARVWAKDGGGTTAGLTPVSLHLSPACVPREWEAPGQTLVAGGLCLPLVSMTARGGGAPGPPEASRRPAKQPP